MGSQGKRRGRRTRSRDGGSHVDITQGIGFAQPEHNPYTIEGRIEQLGLVARGINRARRRGQSKGTLGLAVMLTYLLILAGGLIGGLVFVLHELFT